MTEPAWERWLGKQECKRTDVKGTEEKGVSGDWLTIPSLPLVY